MPTPRLITEQEFRSSRYGQVADQVEGRLSDIIVQAEDYIERTLDRTLTVTTYTELHRPRLDRIFLHQRPIVSLITIRRRTNVRDPWVPLDLTTFELEEQGRIGVIRALIDNIAGYEVEVTYQAGFVTIPSDLKAAVILQTVIFAYQDLEVYGAGDGRPPGIRYLQDDVDRLLRPYSLVKIL